MISRNGDAFKAHLLSRGGVPSTVRDYLGHIHQWEEWCASESTSPVTATQGDIARWLQNQNGLCAGSLADRLTALRAYYNYAVSTGQRPDDPTGSGCLKMFLPLAPVTDPEIARLLAECEMLGEDDSDPDTKNLDRPLDMAEVRRVFSQVLDAPGSSIGMNASVNELVRQAALFVEVEGWASPGLLARRLRVNRHIAAALVETLRDQGLLREQPPHWQPAERPMLSRTAQRSRRKGTWKGRRKNPRLFICADCGQEYEPSGANQKRCSACRGVTATLTATGAKVGVEWQSKTAFLDSTVKPGEGQ